MKLDIQKFADGEVIIPVNLDTKGFDRQIAQVEYDLENLLLEYKDLAGNDHLTQEQAKRFEELGVEIEKTRNKLIDLKEKQQKLGNTHGVDILGGINDISKQMDGVISKVAKWGLAIFSVRSAYSFVRQSMATLSAQNKELARNIENIKYGLASSLEPIIQRIVQWAYKLMQAINYVWKLLTGNNLFSNIKNNLDGASKSAKKLQKTMASFDEMNVLNDNSSSGGGGGGSVLPTEDLTATNLLSEKTKENLQKIAEIIKKIWDFLQPIGEWLLKHPAVLVGALATIVGFKIGKKVGDLITLIGASGSAGGLCGALLVLDALLVGKIVKDVKEKLIPAIKEAKEGIEGTIDLLKGVDKNTKKVTNSILDNAKAENENTDATRRNVDFLLQSIRSNDKLNQQYKDQYSLVGFITGENDLLLESIMANDEQTTQYLDTLAELYNMNKLETDQVNAYRTALEDEIKKIETKNKSYKESTEEYQKNAKRIEELRFELEKIPKTTTSTINIKSDTSKARKEIEEFLKDVRDAKIPSAIGLGMSAINKAINTMKMAKGGIVNLPSRGVPVGGAIAGERGAEGVIPLTDSQQMSLLGEAIGRYITVNANITNTMNGRIISRELQKIQQENSFSSNR